MAQQTGSKLGKEYVKAVYFHPAYLTYMRNARLDEAQGGIKIAGRNINNFRYAGDTTQKVAESEEELKNLLMKNPSKLLDFKFIRRLFNSSSLSAIRVVSSAYLRLLIFLPAILIPPCVSSSPAFLMMYSAYKLNKQGDNIQP